jgi:DNA replication protein DnaC
MTTSDLNSNLNQCLKDLKLPTIRACFQPFAQRAQNNTVSYEQYLYELAQHECDARQNNTIQRYLRESQLPLEKNLEAFDLQRLPAKTRRQFNSLLDGSFLDRKENILIFGNPGTGKTHLLCALCQALAYQGRRVLFLKSVLLVQQLLKAKAELRLTRLLKTFARFDALLIDDIGYVQQSKDEVDVLFTLLAERYERSSVLITSNLPFSKWDGIFKDPMMTAAAIDRLVHHSVIIELNLESYRIEQARLARPNLG